MKGEGGRKKKSEEELFWEVNQIGTMLGGEGKG
jgi:hypothetical protein